MKKILIATFKLYVCQLSNLVSLQEYSFVQPDRTIEIESGIVLEQTNGSLIETHLEKLTRLF